MFKVDFARKSTLAEYGFRLPSCVDNRPLKFEEWDAMRPQTIYVSATPGPWEMERTAGVFVERSEEHTSELQSLMHISYAVFCLKKKKKKRGGNIVKHRENQDTSKIARHEAAKNNND